MTDERDALQPQLEELRWRNRQADKELAQLKEAAEAAQQVVIAIHPAEGL